MADLAPPPPTCLMSPCTCRTRPKTVNRGRVLHAFIQIEALESVERAFVTVDYTARRGELEHKVGRGWLERVGKRRLACLSGPVRIVQNMRMHCTVPFGNRKAWIYTLISTNQNALLRFARAGHRMLWSVQRRPYSRALPHLANTPMHVGNFTHRDECSFSTGRHKALFRMVPAVHRLSATCWRARQTS